MRVMMALFAMLLWGGACEAPGPAEYFYGHDLSELQVYTPVDDSEGVHPSGSVLDNPQNPFSQIQPNNTNKWDLEASSRTVAFFGWASLLVFEPTGEHQFYAALNLKSIYQKEECEPDDLDRIKKMAISGFQAVLTHFPGSVSYLADGETSFFLAPLAAQNLSELGGELPAGYELEPNAEEVP